VPNRFHAITDELAKFGTIGLINLGVNFGVFNLLLLFTLMQGSEVKAKAVATIGATTCAYFLNRHWTYRHRPKTTLRREYTLFFFFNAVGLVIETAFVALAKYGLHETNLIVLNVFSFCGIAVGTVFRFWAYRTHVFKPETPAEELAAPVSPAIPATRVLVPQTLAISHRAARLGHDLPSDETLHEELEQLELADLVEDEVDKATRR
jgi:putative flippase GtrA